TPNATATRRYLCRQPLPRYDHTSTNQQARGHCLVLVVILGSSAGKAAFGADLAPSAFGTLCSLFGEAFSDLRQRVPNLHTARYVLWRVLPKFFKAVRVLRREQH